MIPKDPIMLLSFVNLKLRDYYANLDEMCQDLDIDKQKLIDKMNGIQYQYSPERNQFV